jgi:pimeloyl-ACP methyl ester carboxylesterase
MPSSLARTALLLAAAAAQCLGQTTTSSSAITCATGLHMIVARGSTEAPGLGRIGVVAGNVSELVPGSSIDAVVYPATFDAYFLSEGTGVLAMTSMIKAYTAACPASKIALIGYSQGGQVAMDVVCGTSETLFNVTADLGDAFAKNGAFAQ